MNTDELSQMLKEQVINLLEDMYTVLPQEKNILLAKAALDLTPSTFLINKFISHVYPHKNKIEDRDRDFFKSDFNFGSFKYLQTILSHKDLTDDDINIIWSYWDSFISIMEQYLLLNNYTSKMKSI